MVDGAPPRAPSGPPPAPGGRPGAGAPGAGGGSIAKLWRKHPWWFVAGGGAVAVAAFVWYEQSKQKNQGKQGSNKAMRTVIFRGRGAGNGDHHGHPHHRHHRHPRGADAGMAPLPGNPAQVTDEQNLLRQVDAVQAALVDYTSAHAGSRAPGGAVQGAQGGAALTGSTPNLSPDPMTPQPWH